MPRKNIQLLLLESVENLGIVGDVVKVKTGYARNYLLPMGLAEFPTEATGDIVYPVAVVAGRLRPEVRSFLLFLFSPEARRIFTDRGFLLAAPPDGAPDLFME